MAIFSGFWSFWGASKGPIRLPRVPNKDSWLSSSKPIISSTCRTRLWNLVSQEFCPPACPLCSVSAGIKWEARINQLHWLVAILHNFNIQEMCVLVQSWFIFAHLFINWQPFYFHGKCQQWMSRSIYSLKTTFTPFLTVFDAHSILNLLLLHSIQHCSQFSNQF